MAKMIDKEPKYEGEKKVWHDFYKNLPSDWGVYNTRSINGRKYDFCVISPNMGLFLLKSKGGITQKSYLRPLILLQIQFFCLERRIQKTVLVVKPEAIGLICGRKFSENWE